MAEKEGGSIEQSPIFHQPEFLQNIFRGIPNKSGAFYKAFQFLLVNIGKGHLARLVIPAKRIAVFRKNQIFKLFSTHLTVFIGHPHIGSAIGEIRPFFAIKSNFNTRFSRTRLLGDVREYFRFDVGGDGLRNISQGFFRNVQPNRNASILYAKPQLTRTMLIKNGGDRDQPIFQFSQTPLQFNGFTFFHG